MVINGAALVASGAADEAWEVREAPELAASSDPEEVGLAELVADGLEEVTEALPAEGVAAAEALGSRFSPDVTTT